MFLSSLTRNSPSFTSSMVIPVVSEDFLLIPVPWIIWEEHWTRSDKDTYTVFRATLLMGGMMKLENEIGKMPS